VNLNEYVAEREAWDPEFRAAGEALRPRCAFQRALVAARLAAGLTQQQLAVMLDKPQSAVARWESGQHQPRVDVLQAVAAALGGSFTILPDQSITYQAPGRSHAPSSGAPAAIPQRRLSATEISR
jgi:transcriptional regulator with XRE-family HTH domain